MMVVISNQFRLGSHDIGPKHKRLFEQRQKTLYHLLANNDKIYIQYSRFKIQDSRFKIQAPVS